MICVLSKIFHFHIMLNDGFYHLAGFPLVARYTGASEVVNSANLDQYISSVQNCHGVTSRWIIIINDG